MDNMSGERELVQRVQTGDASAAGELFVRYWRAARAVGFAVTGEWAAAEDAASDGLCEALSGIQTLQDPGCFASWLRTIVIRKARAGCKRTSLCQSVVSDRLPDPSERPDEELNRHELAGVLHQAMRQLPESLREVIALHYFEGYAPADAALFLDVPAGTFRRRLHDGRRRLRTSVEQILNGSRPMHETQMERLKGMITAGRMEQAMREILALRPPPEELLDLLRRRRSGSGDGVQLAVRAASILEGASSYASGPDHPVGAVALAIRRALPEFQEWPLSLTTSASHLFGGGEYRDRLREILPPGFAEGDPGAFVRATRGIVHLALDGQTESVHELMQRTPQHASGSFRIRISEVLDLTWMVRGPLELRSVQETIERLTATVLPNSQARFSSYHEPRYRAAFRLDFAGVRERAAVGGVLAEWPGRPNGVDAAYVRIFLEPWASAQTGQRIEFMRLPETLDPHD